MMTQFYHKSPIYPIISLAISIGNFAIGLWIAKEFKMVYFMLGLGLVYIAFGYGQVLIKGLMVLLPIALVVSGLAYLTGGHMMIAFQTFGRIMILVFASVLMLALPPVLLMRNCMQMGVPRLLVMGILVTMRFLPLLLEEVKQIKEAMKTRGAHVGGVHLKWLYRAFLVPFFMRLMHLSDVMAVSMEIRGYDLHQKEASIYKKVTLTFRDIIFVGLIGCLWVGVFIL